MVKPPFRLMFIAKSQSGKTTLLVKLILKFWLKAFDRIYIFCPTYYCDETWASIDSFVKKDGKVIISSSFNSEEIEKIWKKSEIRKKKDSNFHSLIILDDCVGEDGFLSNSSSNVINMIACKGNHSNLSMIWCVQKITNCSTIMRSQCDGVITFYNNRKESKIFYNEYGVSTEKIFNQIMNQSTEQPYHYLYINRQGPGKPDYYHNFKFINVPVE